MSLRRKRTFRQQRRLSPILARANERKHAQQSSERHKKTFATCDNKNEGVMLALGEKSFGNDNANCETLPDKKKAAAQNDEQPTDDSWRRLIARKPTTNHHQTDGQMNKRKTSEEGCKPPTI